MTLRGEARIERLAETLADDDVDCLLVSAPANVSYLCGYTGSNGVAIIAAAGSGQDDLFLTDFRYETQAKEQLSRHAPALRRVIMTGDLVEAAGKLLAEGEGQRVGFDDLHLSVARYERLEGALDDRFELIGRGGAVERLREVKDAEEQRLIAVATELADQALRDVLQDGLIGRTERAVAIELESRMRNLGAQAPSFPSIVASGPHGALPHAQPRDEEIRAGTLVTIDWGCILDGYCSDCTRTYAAGPVSERHQEIYALVLEAQQAGLDAVVAGRSGKEVDAIAREVIDEAGYGERFGHGLGHGVGIEIHEGPRLSRTAGDQPLRVGNVVTVEPGVYLPGELGVRIEDLLVVRESGPLVLGALSKELTVVA